MRQILLLIYLACQLLMANAEQPSITSAYQDFSCGEIQADRERVIGRINEVELTGIQSTRGEAEAAVAKLLIFWPALLMSSSASTLDELSALKKIERIQTEALNEKGCNDKNIYEVAPTHKENSATSGKKASDRDYEIALEEIEKGSQVRALWARSLATSNGSDAAARSAYIRLRVEQLSRNSSPAK